MYFYVVEGEELFGLVDEVEEVCFFWLLGVFFRSLGLFSLVYCRSGRSLAYLLSTLCNPGR